MTSFSKLATVTASTKRSGGIVNGLEVGFTTEIASLACLPLDPVSPEIAQVMDFAFMEILETSVDGGLDIVEGDILVVGSAEYPIRAVEDWAWKGSNFKRLYLEDRK
jgi:hypothetical protein